MHSLSEWYACLAFHSLSYLFFHRSAMHFQHSVVVLSPNEVWFVYSNEKSLRCPHAVGSFSAAISPRSLAHSATAVSVCAICSARLTAEDCMASSWDEVVMVCIC